MENVVSNRASTAIRELVDTYRTRCLWFLDEDYYPTTLEEQHRVLDYIQRYGDRRAYLEAAEVRKWLSPSSKDRSAGS